MRLLLPTSLLLVACSATGGVKTDTAGTDPGDTTIEDPGDIRDACEDRADEIITETFRIQFAETTGGCPWGEDGNLPPQQGVLTARVEQTEALDLENRIVCDMSFRFAGEAGLEQDIVYDDNFLFVFNGVVLAASYGPWVDALATDGMFRVYDWSRLAGLENLFDAGIPSYCAGEDAGLAECDIPPPETRGPIRLTFDLAITSELSFRSIEEGRSEFTFIATGDNDTQIDCSHEDFWFDVEVPYLPLL